MDAYRLTRNQTYLNPKCEGHIDLDNRSACHLKAESEQDAIAQMEHLFPLDTAGFTCELWEPELEEDYQKEEAKVAYSPWDKPEEYLR